MNGSVSSSANSSIEARASSYRPSARYEKARPYAVAHDPTHVADPPDRFSKALRDLKRIHRIVGLQQARQVVERPRSRFDQTSQLCLLGDSPENGERFDVPAGKPKRRCLGDEGVEGDVFEAEFGGRRKKPVDSPDGLFAVVGERIAPGRLGRQPTVTGSSITSTALYTSSMASSASGDRK